MCARIEATTEPASDQTKSHSLCSLRGAMARIAYRFMDFHSNSRTAVGVLCEKISHAAVLRRNENCLNAAALCAAAPPRENLSLFHDFEFEVELFSAQDCREIEF